MITDDAEDNATEVSDPQRTEPAMKIVDGVESCVVGFMPRHVVSHTTDIQ